MPPLPPKTASRAQRIVLSAVLLALGAAFLGLAHRHVPLGEWLLWRYLNDWACALLMTLGCLGAGEQVVLRLVGRIRGLHAHLYVSFTVGLLLFGLLLFACGMLQLYGPICFYAAPAVMLAIGAPRLWILARELVPRLRRLAPLRIRGPWPLAIIVFGMFAWLLIYAGVLTPENVMFDSEWKHVASAESYAAHGGIFRYGQGYMFGARPQLATYLYTWAFLLPGGLLFDKVTLCGHLELVIFAMTTLLGIPAMVRRLIPSADPSLVWVARFLFPGVFLYDSNLSIGADHIAAAFAIPLFLVTQDLIRRAFRLREAALLGLLAAGVLLTKETAAALLLPPTALALVVGALQQAYRARRASGPLFDRHRWIAAAAVILAVGLAFTTPLWLKNLVWYGDPLYPNLYKYFDPRPWSADSRYLLEWGFYDYQWLGWHHAGENRLLETLRVLFTWSFEPHDWPHFHGRRPVIGSLLTLLLPCLLLLPRTKKLWVVVLWIHIGIAAWFQALPQDRYLQVLMPWMAAVTAAILVHAWRSRVRVAVVALVGLQIAWGGDVYFLHRNMLPKVVDLFAASRDPEARRQRLVTQEHFSEVGRGLPPDARIIVHENHPRLGTGVVTLDDWQTYQFGLAYGLMESPRAVWEAYRALGVTHLYWVDQRSRSWDSVAGDLMFFDMAVRHTRGARRVGPAWIARLTDEAPEGDDFDDRVFVVGCGDGYPTGEYRLRDLRVPTFGPEAMNFPAPRRTLTAGEAPLRAARELPYVVVDPACTPSAGAMLVATHRLAAKRGDVSRLKEEAPRYHLYIRAPNPTRAARAPTRAPTHPPLSTLRKDPAGEPTEERREEPAEPRDEEEQREAPEPR